MSVKKLVKPITPEEIMDNLGKIIPSVVFEAVNYLLKEKYRGSSLSIKQDEIINKIISLNSSITRLIILKKIFGY
jgi:hypothetical protein